MIIIDFQDSKLPKKSKNNFSKFEPYKDSKPKQKTSQTWKEISQNFGGPWVQNIHNIRLLVDSRPLFANKKDEQNVGNKHLALVDWLMDKFVYKQTQTGNWKHELHLIELPVPALIDHPLTKKTLNVEYV